MVKLASIEAMVKTINPKEDERPGPTVIRSTKDVHTGETKRGISHPRNVKNKTSETDGAKTNITPKDTITVCLPCPENGITLSRLSILRKNIKKMSRQRKRKKKSHGERYEHAGELKGRRR